MPSLIMGKYNTVNHKYYNKVHKADSVKN